MKKPRIIKVHCYLNFGSFASCGPPRATPVTHFQWKRVSTTTTDPSSLFLHDVGNAVSHLPWFVYVVFFGVLMLAFGFPISKRRFRYFRQSSPIAHRLLDHRWRKVSTDGTLYSKLETKSLDPASLNNPNCPFADVL